MEKKRQHYVPQFYIKHFSPDNIHINVYNLKRKEAFLNEIKTTFQEKYFYGKEIDFEENFNYFENDQRPILSRIISDGSLRNLTMVDGVKVLFFIINQCSRTKAAKRLADSKVDLYDKYLPLVSQDPDDQKKSAVGINETESKKNKLFERAILESNIWVTSICDMAPILIKNTTDSNFISSDAPVVKNNYIINEKYSFMGFQSVGLQIFLPLNPKFCLLLYDPVMYTIPNMKQGIIELNDRRDIDKINHLQIMNCLGDVIFSDSSEKEYVKSIHLELEKEKKPKSMVAKSFHEYKQEGEITKEIIVIQTEGENPNLKFSFIKQDHHIHKKIKEKIRKSVISGKPVHFYRNMDVVNRVDQDSQNLEYQMIIWSILNPTNKSDKG
jgi:hypothetical protein